MPLLGRRAFTLVELIVALVLLGVVAAGIHTTLATNQRVYVAAAQRIDLQQNLRAAASVLPAELRQLDAADADVSAMSPTSLTIRAPRQLGVLCVAPAGTGGAAVSVIVRQQPLLGAPPAFTAGDSLLLYYEGDPATRNDDTWLRGAVAAVARDDCPDPDRRRPGQRLTLRLEQTDGPPSEVVGGIPRGSPVRGFITATYAQYRSPADGQWYLGQRVAGATIQPLVGPLVGPSGLTFTYYDSSGAPAAAPSAVREIEIRLRGRTTRPVRGWSGRLAYAIDSFVTRVALRNNRRCVRCP